MEVAPGPCDHGREPGATSPAGSGGSRRRAGAGRHTMGPGRWRHDRVGFSQSVAAAWLIVLPIVLVAVVVLGLVVALH